MDNEKKNQRFLNAKEVAKMLCCNKETVYRMVRTDQIPHFRIGTMIRFSMDEIENWIKGK